MSNFIFYTSLTLFVIMCVFLILLVLIQKGRGGGLSSAFGGSGGNTAFGTKTGDVLTWATSIVFAIFITLAVVLNLSADYQWTHSTSAAVAPSPVQTVPTVPATPTGH
jgi:preprotein translocase subunit SecG